ncbi:4998_t:CDS:2 [Entrophospora sp. SA101]|nr:4998_t:CDS:2 [Entrophospora sp. SA101]
MVVNAIPHQLLKRTTTFNQCPPINPGEQPPPQLNVVLSSDPTPIGDPTTAPTDPKTPFSQVLNVIVPETLPDPYGIVAVVVNPKAGEVTGCALSIPYLLNNQRYQKGYLALADLLEPQTKKESQSNNSSEQNGEDMVQMFSVFQTRMEKKVRDRQEKLENDCNKTMQQMRKEMKVNKYKNQYQEYKEEKYSILERLKSENLKLLQNYKSIVNELARVEMSQMKEFQIFEKKYNSFIEEIEAIQNE